MTKRQPEALRLVDWCDANSSGIYRPSAEAASELRRLYQENQELLEALKALQHSLDYEDLLHDDKRAAYCKALELIEKQEK